MPDEAPKTKDEKAIPDDKKSEATDAKKELDSKTVQVKISSPFKTYFSGPANSVSAENETGPFDVLPRHHNFMTLLNPGDVTVRFDDKEQKYRIARGIMHVKDNEIIIFLDI